MKLSTVQQEKLFKLFKHDFDLAKRAKVEIDQLISQWNDLYYGKTTGNKKLLMKEVAKMIESMKPSITEPFLHTSNPIRVARAGNFASKAEVENYANGVFAGELDREEFINDIVDIILREGTVWTRTGWQRETSMKEISNIVSSEELFSMDVDTANSNLVEVGPDQFKLTERQKITLRNNPNSRVCRNEHCFPDPSARQRKEMNFFCEKRYVTYYDLVKMGIFPKAKLNLLKAKILSGEASGHFDKGVLEVSRDERASETGVDTENRSGDLNRVKVQLIEYWGFYDVEDNGKRTAMVASWIQEYDLLLEIAENPYPSEKIPYENAVYSSRPFSLWGNAVAFFIGENQNVKNGLTRSILDSAALANAGQKFIQRGAVDFTNFARLKNRERYVMVNKPDGIQEGKFNNIPASTFSLLELVNRESGQQTGVDNAPAVSGSQIGKEDGNQQLTLSQQKMVSIVRTISGLLGRNVKEWLEMAEVFLEDDQIIEMFSNDNNSENDQYDINAFRNSRGTVLSVTVGTTVAKQQELHNLNMLMQQSKVLGEQLPEGHINKLVARMFDLFDMYEEATALRTYVPKPDPMEEQMMQIEMQKQMLEVQLLQAQIQEVGSKVQMNSATAGAKTLDSQAGAAYKQAQSGEKLAKTESHQVDSALRPGVALLEMQEKIKNLREKGNANERTK